MAGDWNAEQALLTLDGSGLRVREEVSATGLENRLFYFYFIYIHSVKQKRRYAFVYNRRGKRRTSILRSTATLAFT